MNTWSIKGKQGGKDVDVDKLEEAADTISGGFVWVLTEQGHDYWREVAENLRKVIESRDK